MRAGLWQGAPHPATRDHPRCPRLAAETRRARSSAGSQRSSWKMGCQRRSHTSPRSTYPASASRQSTPRTSTRTHRRPTHRAPPRPRPAPRLSAPFGRRRDEPFVASCLAVAWPRSQLLPAALAGAAEGWGGRRAAWNARARAFRLNSERVSLHRRCERAVCTSICVDVCAIHPGLCVRWGVGRGAHTAHARAG